MLLKDKFQRMLSLQQRLGDWELVRPGRELLKEGMLQKISRKGVSFVFFNCGHIRLHRLALATSSFSVTVCSTVNTRAQVEFSFQRVKVHQTTPQSNSYFSGTGDSAALRLSYTIELSQLHVHVPRAEEFQNEFSITSSVRSCTLRARDLKERNEWLEALNSAIEEFRSRKATFLAMDQLSGLAEEEHCVGDSAPVWIPDQRVTMCQACSSEFGLVVRRHHCRACGRVVCSPCSASKAPLRYRQFQSGRVCDICFEALEKGSFVLA